MLAPRLVTLARGPFLTQAARSNERISSPRSRHAVPKRRPLFSSEYPGKNNSSLNY